MVKFNERWREKKHSSFSKNIEKLILLELNFVVQADRDLSRTQFCEAQTHKLIKKDLSMCVKLSMCSVALLIRV